VLQTPKVPEFLNKSDDMHPLHLHRHNFEITKIYGKETSGILKDTVLEFVERRKWLSEQIFADLVALCNFPPGPTSSQVCYSIGMTRGGIPDAISAWERVYDSVGSHHVVSRLRHPLAERGTERQLVPLRLDTFEKTDKM
jgi:hypothetical protein